MAGDVIDLAVMGGGLLLILGLAVLTGWIDGGARDAAWRRIADARRLQHERERALLECLNNPMCRDCPSWRYLRDLHGE